MNKEQIRQQYLEEIEKSIQNAEEYVDNPRFDCFLNMQNGRKYSWFNSGRYDTGIAGTTAAMNDFTYHIEDDGMIIGIWYLFEYKHEFLDEVFTKEEFLILTFDISYGDWNELSKKLQEKINEYSFAYPNAILKEFTVRNFNWEFFDFLMEVEKEFQETVDVITKTKEFHLSRMEAVNDWKLKEAICLSKIKQYILAKPFPR